MNVKKQVFVLFFFSVLKLFSQDLDFSPKATFKIFHSEVEKVKKLNSVRGKKTNWLSNTGLIFLFNQSTFSNWLPGGENSLSVNFSLKQRLNYAKEDIVWDNRIRFEYGVLGTGNEKFSKKTTDVVELNSILGIELSEYWYGSFFCSLNTQLTAGYEYSQNADGEEIRKKHTSFFSPASIKTGFGFFLKKNSDFKVNFSPITMHMIVVDSEFTRPNFKYFGVKQGESFRLELGANIQGYFNFQIFDNVVLENVMELYSNYLENPENLDINYRAHLSMKINKYLSSDIMLELVYNDNAFRGFQVKEILGIGINYSF